VTVTITPMEIATGLWADLIIAAWLIRWHRRRTRDVDIPGRNYDPSYPRHGFRVLGQKGKNGVVGE
jgi:hypothetical protein